VLRVNVSRGKYDSWNDTIYVEYRANSGSEPRILVGDIIGLWGEFVGIKSYTAVLGQTIQIPYVVGPGGRDCALIPLPRLGRLYLDIAQHAPAGRIENLVDPGTDQRAHVLGVVVGPAYAFAAVAPSRSLFDRSPAGWATLPRASPVLAAL
jgi:hypothetical protein